MDIVDIISESRAERGQGSGEGRAAFISKVRASKDRSKDRAKGEKSKVKVYDTIMDALSQGFMGQIFSTVGSDRLYVITKQRWGKSDKQAVGNKVAKGFTPGSSTPGSSFKEIKGHAIRTMLKHGTKHSSKPDQVEEGIKRLKRSGKLDTPQGRYKVDQGFARNAESDPDGNIPYRQSPRSTNQRSKGEPRSKPRPSDNTSTRIMTRMAHKWLSDKSIKEGIRRLARVRAALLNKDQYSGPAGQEKADTHQVKVKHKAIDSMERGGVGKHTRRAIANSNDDQLRKNDFRKLMGTRKFRKHQQGVKEGIFKKLKKKLQPKSLDWHMKDMNKPVYIDDEESSGRFDYNKHVKNLARKKMADRLAKQTIAKKTNKTTVDLSNEGLDKISAIKNRFNPNAKRVDRRVVKLKEFPHDPPSTKSDRSNKTQSPAKPKIVGGKRT